LANGRFVAGDVEIEDGRVVRYGLAVPTGRGLAVPGFVDLAGQRLARARARSRSRGRLTSCGFVAI
jgi:hypothetical protein